MTYSVLVSRTFQKIFQKLPQNIQERIKQHLKELEKDPFTCRSQCDIKVLQDTDPKKYRLRVGEYRIIYIIDDSQVKVLDLIQRKAGYSQI